MFLVTDFKYNIWLLTRQPNLPILTSALMTFVKNVICKLQSVTCVYYIFPHYRVLATRTHNCWRLKHGSIWFVQTKRFFWKVNNCQLGSACGGNIWGWREKYQSSCNFLERLECISDYWTTGKLPPWRETHGVSKHTNHLLCKFCVLFYPDI